MRADQRVDALTWRIGHVARRLIEAIAAGAIRLVTRVRWLHHVPRRLLVPVERALICGRATGSFDPDLYLSRNGDVLDAGCDALDHYLRFGWREGRSANADLDDGLYRASHDLPGRVPVSALAHALAFRAPFGRAPGDDGPWIASDETLDLTKLRAALDRLEPGPGQGGDAALDVIVPVYGGEAETLNTLLSVLTATTRHSFALIVINDASPVPSLTMTLRRLAARGLITLIEAPENRGFVASINAGMRCHPDRDVVWLNADTQVFDGWLDRLHRAAYSQPHIATVTPLTNNGTICSYPVADRDNPGPLGIAYQDLDALAAGCNAGVTVETPTAVGFATYVRRDALDQIGPLDQAAFGLGYGEENDFSQRAIAQGWTNLIAADVFVRHFGATSFAGSKADRVDEAMRVMDRRHPGYRLSVRSFQRADPLFNARAALDRARLTFLSGPRNVLLVSHSRGGGTEQHVRAEAVRLTREGCSVYLLSGGASRQGTGRLGHVRTGTLPTLDDLALDGEPLWQILGALNFERVVLHHLIDFPVTAPALFQRRLAALGVPFEFVVHDYYAICPRINLVDRTGRYCGEPDATACQRCLAMPGAHRRGLGIQTWRRDYHALLSCAEQVRVPDQDGARRLSRYFPDLATVTVVPHEPDPPCHRPVHRSRSGPPRIAVIGAIGPIKGFDPLLALCREARRSQQPLDVTVIGYTRNDGAAKAAGVTVTGAYRNDAVDALISTVDPDLIWIPSLWPETFCYTLSIALRSGRPVAVFDLGAQAARLRAARGGTVIPLDLAARPDALLTRLLGAMRHIGDDGDGAAVSTGWMAFRETA